MSKINKMDVPIFFESPISSDRADELHDNLAAAGQTLRDNELDIFLFAVLDSNDQMTAGCKGEIAFRSARISELWVDEVYRGQGIGSALLEAAEIHAKEKNCIRVHIETRNEKARILYEKLGYRVFGCLPDYEGENAFYYLEKRLA